MFIIAFWLDTHERQRVSSHLCPLFKKKNCFIRLPVLRPVDHPWYLRSYPEWWLISYQTMTSLVQNLTMKGMRFTSCAFIPSPRQIIMFIRLVIHVQYFYGRSVSVCLGVVRDTKMVKHNATFRKSRSWIRKERKGIPGWENSMRKRTEARDIGWYGEFQGRLPM